MLPVTTHIPYDPGSSTVALDLALPEDPSTEHTFTSAGYAGVEERFLFPKETAQMYEYSKIFTRWPRTRTCVNVKFRIYLVPGRM